MQIHKAMLAYTCLILSFLIFFCKTASAASFYCPPASGTLPIVYSLGNITITNPSVNQAGYVEPEKVLTSSANTEKLTCACSDTSVSYTHYYAWGDTNLTNGTTIGDYVYYDIESNENIQVGIKVSGKLGSGTYYNVPFGPIANSPGRYSCLGSIQSGGSNTAGTLKVSLRIKKPFTGTSTITEQELASIYWTIGNSGGSTHGPDPVSTAYLSGSITVPQECTINEGETVTVDLGSIYADQLSTQGQKPKNYTDKTFSIPIQCNSIASTANVSMHIQAQTSGNVPGAIQSSNPDVGVVITDANNLPIKLNDASAAVPYVIDDNYKGVVEFHAYPINTTGNTPDAGDFSALALLVIDFS